MSWKNVFALLGVIYFGLGLFPLSALGQQCRPDLFRPVLLVGHSHKRAGALSARGKPEFSFNQRLAASVADGLRKAGFTKTVIVNFEGNIDNLEDKVQAAKKAKADVVLSFHHDSVQPQYLSTWVVDGKKYRYSDRFVGYSLFVSKKNPRFGASFAFARTIGENLRKRGLKPTLHHAEPIKGENRTLLDKSNGVYQFDDLIVLKHADAPAVLLEAGVIVHRDEEIALQTAERQNIVVDSVVDAVRAYCQGASKGNPSNGK